MQPLTWMSMAGVGLYILTALSCICAGFFSKQYTAEGKDHRIWLFAAACFAMLAFARFFQWEEWLHLWLKDELLASGGYEGRRIWQRPFVAAVLVAGAGIAVWMGRKVLKRNVGHLQPTQLAAFSLLAMVGLIVLRVVSFHATDRILYGLRLNWILDPGLTLLVLGAALWSVRKVRHPT